MRAEGPGSLGGREGCSGETPQKKVRLGPIFDKGEVLVKHKSEWGRPLLKASDGCHLVHSQSQVLAGPSRPCLSEPISSLASLSPSIRARRVGGLSVPVARSSELASSPGAPHPLACRAVAQAAVRLSGLATQDRWRGIISASQSAMAAAVVGRGRASHTLSMCVSTHTSTHAVPHSCPRPSPAS